MTRCARSNSRSLQPSGTSTTHSATVLFSAGFVHVATGVGSPMNLYMRQQAGRGLRNPLARLASTRAAVVEYGAGRQLYNSLHQFGEASSLTCIEHRLLAAPADLCAALFAGVATCCAACWLQPLLMLSVGL